MRLEMRPGVHFTFLYTPAFAPTFDALLFCLRAVFMQVLTQELNLGRFSPFPPHSFWHALALRAIFDLAAALAMQPLLPDRRQIGFLVTGGDVADGERNDRPGTT
jgi:hypothetical protein